MSDVINRKDYENKDTRENAFVKFHKEIGDKIGMTDAEVNAIRRRANAQNTRQKETIFAIYNNSVTQRKEKLSVLERKRVKAALTAQTLAVGVENETRRIKERETIIEKLNKLTPEQWEILMEGIEVT